MEQKTKYVEWLQNNIKSTDHGEVGLIFHIRQGKVQWIEKINRHTEKIDKYAAKV